MGGRSQRDGNIVATISSKHFPCVSRNQKMVTICKQVVDLANNLLHTFTLRMKGCFWGDDIGEHSSDHIRIHYQRTLL